MPHVKHPVSNPAHGGAQPLHIIGFGLCSKPELKTEQEVRFLNKLLLRTEQDVLSSYTIPFAHILTERHVVFGGCGLMFVLRDVPKSGAVIMYSGLILSKQISVVVQQLCVAFV